MNGGLSTPSIVTSSWLSASPPPMPPIPGKTPWLTMCAAFVDTSPDTATAAPAARWRNIQSRHAALSQIRSPLGLIAPYGP